eukprot:gene19061-24883_t
MDSSKDGVYEGVSVNDEGKSTASFEITVDESDKNDQSIKKEQIVDDYNYSMVEYFKNFTSSILRKDEPADIIVTAESYSILGPLAPLASFTDNFFRISDRGSTIRTEFYGGMTTFFSMCYIMVLNVNAPIALAPGMGLNGFFSKIVSNCEANPSGLSGGTACPGWGESSLPWTDAMGAVFISGLFYLFFTFSGIRAMLFRAVPPSLRAAIAVGIGFFITIIGLDIGQIIRINLQSFALPGYFTLGDCVVNPDNTVSCFQSVDLNFADYNLGIVKFNDVPAARIAVLGLIFATALEFLHVKGSIIISILLATFIGINYVHCHSLDAGNDCVTNLSSWGQKGGPQFIVDVSTIPSGKLTFKYAHKPFFWSCVWTFLFVEMFDSFGTITALMTRCGFFKDKQRGQDLVNKAMCIDGFGLALGGIIGANSITCFVESFTGVAAGARTGFASIVTGSAFLLSLLFVQPFVGIIPDAATTCALVMVGIHTLSNVKEVNFDDFIDQASAFLTISIMGFTYSITNGICAGFIFFTWMRTLRFIQDKLSTYFNRSDDYGPSKDVDSTLPHPLMYLMSIFMSIRFAYLKA